MRCRGNDTVGTLREICLAHQQAQACLCEAVATTLLEHCVRAFWPSARTVAMTLSEQCVRAFWAISKNRLVCAKPWQRHCRSRRNDTVGTMREGFLAHQQAQACLCEAVATTLSEHCVRAVWPISKHKLVCAKPGQRHHRNIA